MLKVEYKKVTDLIPYARNARTHSDEQIAQIAASIKEFGWTNPILIDGENGIIAGHGRLAAARKLNLEKVPCIELSGLTEAQKKAYILADNRLPLNAGWDDELLKIEIQDLKSMDFDISNLGFGENELSYFDDIDSSDDISIVDNPSDEFRIIVICNGSSEAKKFSDHYGLNLDITRQIIKCNFSDLAI